MIKAVDFLINIGYFLWSIPLLVGLLALGLLLAIGDRMFQFRHLGFILKRTLGSKIRKGNKDSTGVSSFSALCMALSNTLGTGNIVGIAVGIAMGGPGALLWIWIAEFVALFIKFHEVTLASKCRELDDSNTLSGGMMSIIRKSLDHKWAWLATVYAALYTLVAINSPALQVNSAVSSITAYFQIPPMLVGTVLVALIAVVGYGGVKRISSFADRVVPVMALVYFAITIVVLIMNITALPKAIGLVFAGAVKGTRPMAGGFAGATISMAARHGLSRGIFSTAAGTGESSFSHACADSSHPVEQGLWGVVESLTDALVCTCTGLMIIITGAWQTDLNGAPLTARALSMNFNSEAFGNLFVIIVLLFFAFTSAVMALYFSDRCIRYFTKNRIIIYIYRTIIIVWCVLSSNNTFVSHVGRVWGLADFGYALVLIIGIAVVFLTRKQVYELTDEYREIHHL